MTAGYAESPLILRLFGTISCFFLAKMVTTTVADTTTSLNMHTEFSTATQQEYRANGDKVQRNSENAREDPAQCTRMGASSNVHPLGQEKPLDRKISEVHRLRVSVILRTRETYIQ